MVARDYAVYETRKLRLKIRAETIRLEFIMTEIETALTFMRSAEILEASGSKGSAATIVSRTWEIYGDAAHQLEKLPLRQSLRKRLTDKLDRIRTALGAL